MYSANIVFSQIMSHFPKYEFNKCVDRYRGNYRVRNFSCWDQFLCMAFAQLTLRSSLRSTVLLYSKPGKINFTIWVFVGTFHPAL
jgi:hypothetical protein